ncbi:MAG: DUF4384 domain-containing protein [Flavobacteriia bacterium]|nr:DUF4384 domain-containing protein [Flavobacteriia bacterium]
MHIKIHYAIAIAAFFSNGSTMAQTYYTGIPEGRDTLYDQVDKKAILKESNYRDVGSRFSIKEYAPIPGDQGQYGTCAAWATTYCARTILESVAFEEKDKEKITKNAYSPGFVYRLASSNANCSGSFPTKCAEQMIEYGAPKFANHSELCPIDLSEDLFELAKENKIKAYAKLFENSDFYAVSDKEKVQRVKKSISEKYPVVISIFCPNSFRDCKGELWQPTESVDSEINHQHGRHALCVVGYDDEKYGGAFEIQNSWGTKWSNNGYVWVSYSDFAKFTYQAIEMIGNENYLNQESLISGGLKVLLSDGIPMTATINKEGVFVLDEAMHSGQRFRLYLNSSAPTYLYALNIDDKGEIDQLFPFEEGVSPLLNYQNNDVPIPSENKQMRLDGETGKEYLCLMYSKKAIDFDVLTKQLGSQSKAMSIYQRFQACFGNRLVLPSNINFLNEDKSIEFEVVTNYTDVVVIVLEIRHLD